MKFTLILSVLVVAYIPFSYGKFNISNIKRYFYYVKLNIRLFLSKTNSSNLRL